MNSRLVIFSLGPFHLEWKNTKLTKLKYYPEHSLLLLIFNHLTVPSFCLPWSSRRLSCYWKSLGSSEVQTSAFYCCLAWLKPHPPTLSPSPFTALNGLPFAKWFSLGDQQMRRSPWELQAHLIEQKTRVFKTSLDSITYPSVLFWTTDLKANFYTHVLPLAPSPFYDIVFGHTVSSECVFLKLYCQC